MPGCKPGIFDYTQEESSANVPYSPFLPRARVHLDAPLSTIPAYLMRKNENEKYSESVRLQAVGSRLIAWRSGLSLVELLLERYDYGVFLLQLPFQTVVYSQHYRVHGILAA